MKLFRLSLFILPWNVFCQIPLDTNKSWLSKHPIEVSFGNNAIALPFKNILNSNFYPQVQLGMQFDLQRAKKIQLNQVLEIGCASHKYNGDRSFLQTQFRVKYAKQNFYSQLGLGLGIALHEHPNQVFVLNDSGDYLESNKPNLKLELIIPSSIELGYHVKIISKLCMDLYVRYVISLSGKHHPEIPVLPYNSLLLGSRIYYNK